MLHKLHIDKLSKHINFKYNKYRIHTYNYFKRVNLILFLPTATFERGAELLFHLDELKNSRNIFLFITKLAHILFLSNFKKALRYMYVFESNTEKVKSSRISTQIKYKQ